MHARKENDINLDLPHYFAFYYLHFRPHISVSAYLKSRKGVDFQRWRKTTRFICRRRRRGPVSKCKLLPPPTHATGGVGSLEDEQKIEEVRTGKSVKKCAVVGV